MSRSRVLLGFLLAPGAPGVLAGVVAGVLGSELAGLAFMLAFLAYIAAIVIGLPAWLYARTRGLAALKRAAVLTANIGLAAYVLVAGFVTLMNALASPFYAVMNFLAALLWLLVPMLYAAAVVWLFWRIALRGVAEPFAR
ncbi:hypothetical protein [Massilia sp. DD77]|uniref:hypothetical protein n=1 Tax=Massilia sp. DD77 TaxID=3109349 RepID=UPI002FFF7995